MKKRLPEKEVKESYIKKLIEIEDRYFRKYGHGKMSEQEIDKLFGK